jgi:hypothetical protein
MGFDGKHRHLVGAAALPSRTVAITGWLKGWLERS